MKNCAFVEQPYKMERRSG